MIGSFVLVATFLLFSNQRSPKQLVVELQEQETPLTNASSTAQQVDVFPRRVLTWWATFADDPSDVFSLRAGHTTKSTRTIVQDECQNQAVENVTFLASLQSRHEALLQSEKAWNVTKVEKARNDALQAENRALKVAMQAEIVSLKMTKESLQTVNGALNALQFANDALKMKNDILQAEKAALESMVLASMLALCCVVVWTWTRYKHAEQESLARKDALIDQTKKIETAREGVLQRRLALQKNINNYYGNSKTQSASSEVVKAPIKAPRQSQ